MNWSIKFNQFIHEQPAQKLVRPNLYGTPGLENQSPICNVHNDQSSTTDIHGLEATKGTEKWWYEPTSQWHGSSFCLQPLPTQMIPLHFYFYFYFHIHRSSCVLATDQTLIGVSSNYEKYIRVGKVGQGWTRKFLSKFRFYP